MSYFIDWRDYVRQPRIKSLIESKGVEAARQEYMRESNKAMWDDPFVINESLYSSADPTTAAASAGGSSPSIVGHVAEVNRFAWASTVTNDVTGSAGDGLHGFYFVSASNFVATNTTGIAGIVTASYSKSTETTPVTGSLLSKLYTAIINQSATAVVAGFTNTIAPNTLFAPTMSAGSSSLSFTHLNKGGVPSMLSTVPAISASVSVTTVGLDRYWGTSASSPGTTFDGAIPPYTTYARRG